MRELVTFLIDLVAVYRLTKLTIDDEIFYEIREKIWEKYPPESSKIGYLFTCPWCMSIWMGGLLLALRKASPETADYISRVLATSAATGIAFSKGL